MSQDEIDRDAQSILHKHADAHLVVNRELAAQHGRIDVHVAAHEVLAEEVGKLKTAMQVMILRINTVEADLEHRIVVLESRMENVLGRLDGHDLGFATLLLDADGREMLANMLSRQHYGEDRLEAEVEKREADRTIVPEDEGTSRS